jgi:Leucine-rich repeat (LRR) protein
MRFKLTVVLFVFVFCMQGRGKDLNDAVPVYTNLATASLSPDSVIQLVLIKKKLTKFPDELWSFKNMEFLDLSKNRLDSIPLRIQELKKLKVLKLSRNNISFIPPQLYKLANLEILVLSDNEMAYISPQIANLKKLKNLDLWRTNISVLPEEMSTLDSLEFLDLRGISLNRKQQSDVLEIILKAKVRFSPPCNCNN